MAAKFYAVRKGKKPGIYMSWDICKQQTDGFPGAEFKAFQQGKRQKNISVRSSRQ